MILHALRCKCEVISRIYKSRCVAKVVTGSPNKRYLLCICVCVCVCGDDFYKGTNYHHHCLTKKINFRFVGIIDKGVW